MKFTFETAIDAPIEKVAQLTGNPDHRLEWMEGLESLEHISGEPGTAGATSRLVFDVKGMKHTFNGTVVANELPERYCETMDASNVFITITTRLVALPSGGTKHLSETEYQFKGMFNKAVGFMLQNEFKKQEQSHLKNFKRFAEKQHEENPG